MLGIFSGSIVTELLVTTESLWKNGLKFKISNDKLNSVVLAKISLYNL